MLVTLDTGYADTTAAHLSFALGGAVQPALRVHEVDTGRHRLSLRLLGASHQVILSTVDDMLIETVACLPDAPAGLPGMVIRRLPGVPEYRFRSAVRRLSATRFRAATARLRRVATADRPGVAVLAGAFPGSPDALTVLVARAGSPDRLRWWTVHAYPQTGELVQTSTVVWLESDGGDR